MLKENLEPGLRFLAKTQEAVSALVPDTVTAEVTNTQVTTCAFALIGEVFELAQELGWKPWKQNEDSSSEHNKIVAEEFADILAFLGLLIFYISQRTGLTTEQLAEAYFQKTEKNIRRFAGKESEKYGYWVRSKTKD